jgi:5'-methylthioadenosine phosphorylase
MEATVADLGIETVRCGVYGHVNGPRFNTRAEIRWLAAAGVTAVSQTCGPEAVLAGELELPYGLVGFGVNYATGVAEPEPKEELDRLLVLSTEVLPRIVLRAVETLEEEDLAFDHGYVYRAEGGIGWRDS